MEKLIEKVKTRIEERDNYYNTASEITGEINRQCDADYFSIEQFGSSLVFESKYLGISVNIKFDDIKIETQVKSQTVKDFLIESLISAI